jgi:hypothetical protein
MKTMLAILLRASAAALRTVLWRTSNSYGNVRFTDIHRTKKTIDGSLLKCASLSMLVRLPKMLESAV